MGMYGVSEFGLGGARERCLAGGMDDYIGKPVKFKDLNEAMRQWAED
jgi:CheY-like chemotaxis protein